MLKNNCQQWGKKVLSKQSRTRKKGGNGRAKWTQKGTLGAGGGLDVVFSASETFPSGWKVDGFGSACFYFIEDKVPNVQ